MKPKEIFIKNAIENGSIDRLNVLLSAVHLLNCTANMYAEEAADLMEANGLLLGRLKQVHNNFLRAADMYCSEFAGLVFDEEKKMAMFADIDNFDKFFRDWAKIEKEWEPKKVEYHGEEKI